jgi:Flp pilus assembly pilin Flp
MLSVWTAIKAHLDHEEDGASLVEYAIAIVAVVAITFLGTQVNSQFVDIGSGLGSI